MHINYDLHIYMISTIYANVCYTATVNTNNLFVYLLCMIYKYIINPLCVFKIMRCIRQTEHVLSEFGNVKSDSDDSDQSQYFNHFTIIIF